MADARQDTAAANVHDDDNHGGNVKAPAAKGGATIPITIVLLVLLMASVAAFLMTSPPRMEGAGQEGGAARTGAEPVEQAVGHGVPGFNSRLDAFRAWAKLTWMKLQQPHSDEPRYDTGGGIAGSAAEAAKKGMEMGKETAEQAAATAADAAGMAKDKVKRAAAPSSEAERGVGV